jgi:hypothetical protein
MTRPYRDYAHELTEAICKELGTSLRHYMPTTKERAIEAAERHLRKWDTFA